MSRLDQPSKNPTRMAIIFIVFSIAFALPNYAQYQFSPLGPQIIERFGLTAMQFNSIFTSPMLPAIFTSIISGMLVDRYGYKPVMGAALFLTAIGAWLRVFAEGYGVMYVGMVLIGFSAGFLSSNASKILSQLFGAEKVGVMMGMALTLSTCTLILAMSTTTMLGPMGNAFMLGAVVATIILVLWFVVMPGIKPGIMVQSAADSTDEAPGLIESLKVAIKNRHVWFAGLALFCVGGAMTGMGSMVPTALMESRGISEAAAGVVGAFLMVGNLLGSLITPTLSLKLGKFRAVLMVCGVMSLLGCAFAWRAPEGILLYAAMVLTGFTFGSGMSQLLSVAVRLPGIGHMYAGTAGGIIGTLEMAGCVILPTYIASQIAGSNHGVYFLVLGISGIVWIFSVFMLPKDLGVKA